MKLSLLGVVTAVLGAAPVGAETVEPAPPPARPAPGLTLPQGSFALTLVTEVNTSVGKLGEPFSLAPDLAVGVTPDLTLSVVHSTFGITGFRGSAGRGLCLAGREHGCPHVYDNAGFETLYSLRRGAFAIAANLGVHALKIAAGHHDLKAGFKLRYATGRVSVTALPSVFVALTERDDAMTPNRDLVFVPAVLAYKVTPAFAVAVATGVKGPIEGFGKGYEVAVALGLQVAISPTVGVGGTWAHGKITGGEATLPDDNGFDFRALHLWVTLTLP
ncbi:MAG: hypothetical protein H0T79_02745 [Deltaproteobacteria bacterium]|nr:hypothetical protein [Deltaproteobacteria bacterium]